MTNHEELRRLATEATPGPWTIHTEEVCSPIVAAMELSKLVHGSVFVRPDKSDQQFSKACRDEIAKRKPEKKDQHHDTN